MNPNYQYQTHNFIKQLISKNISHQHAEAIVEMIMDIRENDLAYAASKIDLQSLGHDINSQLQLFKQEFYQLELRLTIKLGIMIGAAGSILKLII